MTDTDAPTVVRSAPYGHASRATTPSSAPHLPPRGVVVGPPPAGRGEGKATIPGGDSGRNYFRGDAWDRKLRDREPSPMREDQTVEEYQAYRRAWRNFWALADMCWGRK